MKHLINAKDDAQLLTRWTSAITYVGSHYRLAFSPGALRASTQWQEGLPLLRALQNLARQAGLTVRILQGHQDIAAWRLPLVVQLTSGQIVVLEQFDGQDTVSVSFMADGNQFSRLSLSKILPDIRYVVALRPAAAVKDSRAGYYLEDYRPDWLWKLVLRDLKPYGYVMLASLLVNILSLAGILFSMQVYDRAIPAQSYPTLYVLAIGVFIAVIFSFLLRLGRGHIMDILGKRADIRVSDRVFGHALRLRNSAIPRSTGSFISQLRELEQIREMVTSTTVSAVVDLPFFLLFLLVLAIIAPSLSWIAPAAALLMILPCLLMQKKLAQLARQSSQEFTLRNAVLVESVQGLEDIKLMQAENRFQQQWNSYISISAESGVRMRKLTQWLISWGLSVQGLVYALVVMIGAPLVIEGGMTTGAIVAASLLSSRMIAPMTTLCGVLARWQQVKAAKEGLDNVMQLPVENGHDESKLHCDVLYGHYQFVRAAFRYHSEEGSIALKIAKLEIRPGERVAILGRNGAGKSTLLQAMAGGMALVEGELRLDNLSLAHIDMEDVRRNIGLVTQHARLFFGTLRENLTLGAPRASDAEIFAVLEVCGADSFVKKLALGLDHPVMEGGIGLSGGQRQSILLARMLLRDPNIVLLDEPTSSLDEHTEQEFIRHLAKWLGGRTLVVATHRVAVLELVERIIVLQEGQLAMDKPKEQALNTGRHQNDHREVKA
ncbi:MULTISPECIES: type I secretion system permease/ATPase [Brenneria]|uniref:Type I secretion system permease/ATPase n=1 Tax=Brenneria nigrifluens DSM 30175 = ATCC 13028 TaxID=1121120 RepID=A0A2U1UFH5_9GAMM|nr:MULTISPECIES: type I secretion system permease/ATPase [Brenneria]EHD19972.1 type I secretion system ATPase [Brenneria sp. EniD312]PWC20367.1 type I secretion system permease/ATPase [Brenneria nigrifluens DSM 30175 = ATCC 13028]QCR03215.1 type I secretion system permease/ATPase [Brenneria nigrifluens DSM 30175 = ATCC 13028]